MAWRLWFRGLIAAIISAAAGSVTMVIVDPAHFNLFGGGARSLGEVALVFAVVAAASYLKAHPLPEDDPQHVSPSAISKVGMVLLIASIGGGLLMLGGCAPKVRHVATVSVVSAHAVLSAVQDLERPAVCGQPTAPAAPACVPVDTHQQISAELVKAFDADARLATLVRDWPQGMPPPSDIPALLASINDGLARILAAIPPGTVKDAIVAHIAGGAK